MRHRGVIVLACCVLPSTALAQSGARARISVGPNILVSGQHNLPHIEPHLGVHPGNAKVLVAGAMVQKELDVMGVAYASSDGGYTWQASTIPLPNVADPQIAIGRTGTVYYAMLSNSRLMFVRSEDAGRSWQTPVELGRGQDHEQIIVDRTTGRNAGRIYIGSLYGQLYDLGVFRSDDDGRTWRGPQRFYEGKEPWGANMLNPLVLSDGALFLPYIKWTRRRPAGQDTTYIGFATSIDGGETFSPPREFTIRRAGADVEAGRPRQFPQFAVNDRATVQRDRIYVIYSRDSLARLYLQYTDDRGATWSRPKRVDAGVPAHAEQFQQMIAVNDAGVVGITWFDSRATRDRSAFDQYFTASVDGGETFLPAVRVSTDSTMPNQPGNLFWVPSASVTRDTTYLYVGTSAGRLDTGGDYMGLATASDGTFHAVWTDARTGKYQLFTSAIRVHQGDVALSARPPGMSARTLRGAEFALVFDPARHDTAGVVSVPMRIKNRTDKPWHAPMTLRLGLNPRIGDRGRVDSLFYPTILDAANGQTGPGAEFDLTPYMGASGVIEPGATTGVFVLRVRKTRPTDPILGRMLTFITVTTPPTSPTTP